MTFYDIVYANIMTVTLTKSYNDDYHFEEPGICSIYLLYTYNDA